MFYHSCLFSISDQHHVLFVIYLLIVLQYCNTIIQSLIVGCLNILSVVLYFCVRKQVSLSVLDGKVRPSKGPVRTVSSSKVSIRDKT